MPHVRCVGIDVSQDTLDVACRDDLRSPARSARFENTAPGRRKLISWLTKRGKHARVVMEATGVYGLDLALDLHRASRTEVMVLNPHISRRFADACAQRSCTDATMALSLLEYCARMDFVPWTCPSPAALELRALARRIAALVQERTRERNRLHAASATDAANKVVCNDIEVNVRHLQRRIALLEQHAMQLINAQPEIRERFDCLTSLRGIAQASAIQLLGELLVLPPDMTVRQLVAYAGLDVRHVASGTSVSQPPRISKRGNAHLRRALFIPALVSSRWEPHVRLFREQLEARGKLPLQAHVAVMRKLLHSIYAMLRDRKPFDGSKFRKLPLALPSPP